MTLAMSLVCSLSTDHVSYINGPLRKQAVAELPLSLCLTPLIPCSEHLSTWVLYMPTASAAQHATR